MYETAVKYVRYSGGASLLGQRPTLALLADQRLVDVRDDPASSNRCLDQRVQLLVSTDRQLEMSRGDPLHLQILGCVAGQLEHLGGEVLQDGRAVDGGSGSNSARGGCTRFEVTVDPENGCFEEKKMENSTLESQTCRQGTEDQHGRFSKPPSVLSFQSPFQPFHQP